MTLASLQYNNTLNRFAALSGKRESKKKQKNKTEVRKQNETIANFRSE